MLKIRKQRDLSTLDGGIDYVYNVINTVSNNNKSLPVRHVIDFSSWNNNITIPKQLESFKGYKYNTEERRISFSPDDKLYYFNSITNIIESKDKAVKDFDDIFFNSNPKLKFLKKFKTYDYIDKTDEKYPDSFRDIKKEGKEFKDDMVKVIKLVSTGVILYNGFLIGLIAFNKYQENKLLYGDSNEKKKEKRA